MKGSSARQQLENALVSVPDSSALEVAQELVNGQTPLGQLFRYRLARFTQGTMVQILIGKALALQERQKAELRRKEEEFRRKQEERRKRIEDLTRRVCDSVKEEAALVDKLCGKLGQDSDECQKRRRDLLDARQALTTQTGLRCP